MGSWHWGYWAGTVGGVWLWCRLRVDPDLPGTVQRSIAHRFGSVTGKRVEGRWATDDG